MTATDPGLLRTILEDPGNTAARLIYADWLEENGEGERSEFIRVQCELADMRRPRTPAEQLAVYTQLERMKNDPTCYEISAFRDDERELYIRRRDRELLAAHGYYWRAIVPGVTLLPESCRFRRGFVEEVRMPLADWVGKPCPCHPNPCDGGCTGSTPALGPAIVLAAPITRVEFTDFEPMQILHGPDTGKWFDSRRNVGETLWPRYGRVGVFGSHETREEAIAALSAAAIAWARKQAGLPEVKL